MSLLFRKAIKSAPPIFGLLCTVGEGLGLGTTDGMVFSPLAVGLRTAGMVVIVGTRTVGVFSVAVIIERVGVGAARNGILSLSMKIPATATTQTRSPAPPRPIHIPVFFRGPPVLGPGFCACFPWMVPGAGVGFREMTVLDEVTRVLSTIPMSTTSPRFIISH